jgi:hypothetical protein
MLLKKTINKLLINLIMIGFNLTLGNGGLLRPPNQIS